MWSNWVHLPRQSCWHVAQTALRDPAAVGLPLALRSFCEEFTEREGVTVCLEVQDGLRTVPPNVAHCLYRVTQETLRDVAKHSGAR